MGRHRRVEGHSDFRLLFVCTGNICRSPLAEILTRHLLSARMTGADAGFEVTSAGIRAVAGAPMQPDSRAQLARWRIDDTAADGFVARQLRTAMVERAHLVLGAGTRHRSTVVAGVPAALPITFSIREFARLVAAVDPAALPHSPVDRAHELVDLARASRGMVPQDGSENIADPMGKPAAAHAQAADQISAAVERIVGVLAPARPPAPAAATGTA